MYRQDCVDMSLSDAMKRTCLLVLDDEGGEAACQDESGEYPGNRVVEGDDGGLHEKQLEGLRTWPWI